MDSQSLEDPGIWDRVVHLRVDLSCGALGYLALGSAVGGMPVIARVARFGGS